MDVSFALQGSLCGWWGKALTDCCRPERAREAVKMWALSVNVSYSTVPSDRSSVVIEVIVFCLHCERHIDLKECLSHGVRLLDVA